MKKLTVITLVLIMLVFSVVPALAAGGPPANRGTASGNCTGNQFSFGAGNQVGFGIRTPYALSGTITAINAEARTVTVIIVCGNRLINPYIGQEVTLLTTDATRFLLRNSDGTVIPITFEDLAVDQNISSHGTLVGGVGLPPGQHLVHY